MGIVFMGTPHFAVETFEQLIQAGHQILGVVTQPDRPKGRGNKLNPSPVKVKALDYGLPIYQPEKVRDPIFIKKLADLKPEVIVVVAYGQILPKEILELPPLGCINVHASLLPKYRGAAPIHWAIINGEKETGVTTMLMDQGLDTGNMLLNTSVEIGSDVTTGELHDKLAVLGGQLLTKTLYMLAKGEITPQPQDDGQATYASLINKEHELINWQKKAQDIHNLIRGMNPWPGAYSFFMGTRLKVWETSLQDYPGSNSGSIGEIVYQDDLGFWVQTGDKPVLIKKIQPAGKNIMTANSFVNGYGLSLGQFLGDKNE
ncbi:MAG: methionyl-tRNA formyltransferase [Peptococcaceae bacterium BICA1-8]|nr:MAG: methionyl-tRNA formyltransferase [Peptococcaceae bacterium BICA1-8]